MADDERDIPKREPTGTPAQAKPAVRRRSEEGASRRPSAASIANRPSAAGQRRSRRKPAKKVTAVGGAAAEVETPQIRELEAQAEKSVVGANVESKPAAAGKSPVDADAGSEPAAAEKPPASARVEPEPAAAEKASAVARNVQYSSAHPEGDGPRGSQSRAARQARARRRKGGKVRGRTSVKAPTEAPEAPTAEALRRQREQLKPADWHTDDASNPYLQEGVEGPQDEYWYEDEQVSPVVPVRDISPKGKRKTSAAIRSRSLVIVLGVFAAMAALTLFVWITRSVEFTLNGTDVSTTYGTSLADYIRENELSFEPGNLVSVSGNVLEAGAGDAYAAKVNGEAFRPEDAGDIHLTGGEIVELGNGLDVMEDHDVKIVQALPKLEFDGDIGAISFVSQWGMPGTQEQLTGKQSGEVALGDYIEAPTNTVVTTLTIVPDDNRKLVALTFDDGPSSYTPQYLDILAQYNAKATFFMFGPSAEQDPEMAKRVIEAGHQVCNHTSVHQDLSALDAEQLQNELRTTFEQVDNAAGIQTTTFRPPWSIFTHDCWLRSGGVASTSVIYTADSRDWDRPGANAIVNYALEGVAPGAIILMHDGGYQLSQDFDALPRILSWLTENGYQCVTLSELLASDSAVSEAVASCNDPMPEGSVWPTEFAEASE